MMMMTSLLDGIHLRQYLELVQFHSLGSEKKNKK